MLLETAPLLPAFLVRQPLLDTGCKVVGQEFSLRDRAPLDVLPGATRLDQVRDEHLIASIIDLEFRDALGARINILDLAPDSTLNPMLTLLPIDKVVVALPAGTPDLGSHVAELTEIGMAWLLDDDGSLPAAVPPGCRLARLDSGRHLPEELGARAAWLRRQGVKWLVAGNVDSDEAFEACRKLGFDFFQGAFLGQPRALPARSLDPGVVQVMELLNLTREEAPPANLEAAFKRNAALTYRLLRYINSPANGLDHAVESIGQALVWLGHDPLYRWLTLLLYSAGEGDGRNRALLKNALVRARFMENLGTVRVDPALRGGLFIVGVLSHLDALLNLPMAQALAPLRLADTARAALLRNEGPYAVYLRLARACERFDQSVVKTLAGAEGMTDETVNLAHIEALIWSESLEK